MKWFVFLVALNFMPTAHLALAKSYSGFIEKSQDEIYIRKNDKKAQLRYSNATIEKLIKKLDPNDFISLEGKLFAVEGGILNEPRTPAQPVQSNKSQLIVDSINFVGLNRLLGYWKDESGLCYLFYTYTSMKTYFPTSKAPCSNLSFQKIYKENYNTFNYFISPDEDLWNMAISNDSTQYVAELIFANQDNLFVTVYDERGSLISKLVLKRQ